MSNDSYGSKTDRPDAAASIAYRATTTTAQRVAGWARLCSPGPVTCVVCAKTADAHVNVVCRECFIGNDSIHAGPIGMTSGGEPGRPPETTPPSCGFCGRAADKLKQDVETMVAGQTAMICSTCASAVAGCIGAKTAGEARGMMALSAMQAEAVVQCNAMMKRVGLAAAEAFGLDGHNTKIDSSKAEDRSEVALMFAQSAELLARIARGGA